MTRVEFFSGKRPTVLRIDSLIDSTRTTYSKPKDNSVSVYVERVNNNGVLLERMWYYISGLKYFHNDSHPAIECFYPDGTKSREEWYQRGVPFRIKGPVKCLWNIDGSIRKQIWFINGENKTREINKWIRDLNIEKDYNKWSVDEHMLYKLTW